jgi:hypothetical protein
MWLTRISNDLGNIPDFLDYFRAELVNAQIEVAIKGNLERNLAALPGVTEFRFGQLQTVESVLEYLNIQLKKIKNKHYRNYLEKYAKALTSRDAEKYADGEADVCDLEEIINSVALIRNQYLGIIKALETKNWMLGHITKLRCVGIEAVEL